MSLPWVRLDRNVIPDLFKSNGREIEAKAYITFLFDYASDRGLKPPQFYATLLGKSRNWVVSRMDIWGFIPREMKGKDEVKPREMKGMPAYKVFNDLTPEKVNQREAEGKPKVNEREGILNKDLDLRKRKEKPKTTPTPSPSLSGIEPDSKPAPGDNLTLPEWLPLEAWAGYLEMRTKKKAPNTKRALQGAINNLDKLRKEGDDPGAVLDQSTFRAWVGLFQLPADVRAARKAEADKIREDAIVEREMAKIHAARAGKGPLPGIKPVSAEEVFDGWIEEGDDD